MNIYNPDGSVLIENVPITSNAKHYEEMMKSNYIKLSWNDNEYKILPTGAYIEWHNVRYKLFEDYQPTIKDEVKCVYEPEFQHPMMILDHTPCLLVTRNSQGEVIKEPTWTYTGTLQLIVGRIQTIIEEELGVLLTTEIDISDNNLAASATVSMDGDSIWSALGKVCQAWENEIEFHVTWDIVRGTTETVTGCIYVGDIAINDESKGGTATLTDGINVVTTSRTENNKNEYANYFNVRGGTRNISIATASGNNVSTDTRMTLDTTKYPNSVIDKRASDNVPKIQETLIFDDVYPSLTLYCHNIRERVRRRQDEDGNCIVNEYNADGSIKSYKLYSVYYMRLAYPTKDKDGNVTAWTEFPFDKTKDMIDGKTLMCSFQANEEGTHSALAGRDFELRYHTANRTIPPSEKTGDSGVQIKIGDWEIVFEEDDDFIIPNSDTLSPYGESNPSIKCDTLLLYNILLTGDYLTNAQNKLLAYAEEEIERRMTDYDNYTLKSYPHIFKQSNPNLFVGQKVTYTNREGTLDTHVIKIETSLECEYVQTITLGNARITGTITSVKDDVKVMSGVIDVNTSSISAITNTLSRISLQIREWANNFLSRKEDDTAAGHITFDAGLTSNDDIKAQANVDVRDTLNVDKYANVGMDASIQGTTHVNAVTSHDYDSAAEAGYGFYQRKDGKWGLNLTDLTIWGKAIFNQLTIRKLNSVDGNIVFSPSASKLSYVKMVKVDGDTITEVSSLDDANGWKCYLLADDGTMATTNSWYVDDQARCQTFDIAEGTYENVSNKSYWRRVIAVSSSAQNEEITDASGNVLFGGQKFAWIVLSKDDCEENSDVPAANDTIVMEGNRTDTDRQSLVIKETWGDDAPREVAYTGVNSYSLAGHVVYEIGPKKVRFYTQYFEMVTATGQQVKQTTYRGQYSSSTSYGYYDEVTYNGTRWLCIVPEGSTATEAPSASSSQWRATTTVLTPQLQIFHDLGAGIAIGESHTVVVKAYLGDEEITSKITKWSVSRNTGQAVEDAAWANKDKVKNFAGTLLIVWTDEEDDLGISETGYTTFTFEATTADGELLSTELTFQG